MGCRGAPGLAAAHIDAAARHGNARRARLGTVRVTGRDIVGLSDRGPAGLRATRIGFVFEQFFLHEHARALKNAADGLRAVAASRSGPAFPSPRLLL